MDIIGAIFFMVLPYMAGYSCKSILRWKETNQIETYLIGFFFLFFLQGVVLVPSVWLGKSLSFVCNIMWILCLVLVVLFGASVMIYLVRQRKKEETEVISKMPWKKTERSYYLLMVLLFFMILLRMVFGMEILRGDIVLETVQTTLQTDSLFTTHPLTGRVMETGMITSKKIVTLPLFYACIAKMTGLEADILLYIVAGVMSLLCSYYAYALLFTKLTTPTRGKLYIFWIVFGLLILAGDYHPYTLSYRILYQGYEGSTICFGVILPYLLYVIVSWYKRESEVEKNTLGSRVMYIFKILLGLAVSVVITGLGTGFVFLFMAMVLAGICCLLKSIKEVRECRES